jgi:hypothetical protein
MQPIDPIIFRELPVIQKIIQDETWLEGERRGCHVRPDDRIVRERVCEVVLTIGQQLRDSLTEKVSGPILGVPANVTHIPEPPPTDAA